MAKEFLGTGMKFPPEIDRATGRFMTVSGDECVKESIWMILFTQQTERFIRPSFGSDIMNFTFMDTDTTMLNILRHDVSRTILSQEPRVSDLDVNTEYLEKQGCVVIRIEYTVTETNTRDNLVFPFYLDNPGGAGLTEEEEQDFSDRDLGNGLQQGPVYYDENGEVWES